MSWSARLNQAQLLGGLALAFGLTAGCGSDETAPPSVVTPAAAKTPAPVAAAPAAPALTDASASATKTESVAAAPKPPIPEGGRVFVDVSASIRGFAIADDIALESLHSSIGNALSKAGVNAIDYCEIGRKHGMKCELDPKPRRYRSAGVYNGTRSEIAAAVAEVPPDAPLTRKGERPISPVDEKGVSIVVTDGIEVSKRKTLTPGEEAAGCLPGLDTYCLQRVLAARAQAGYGVWVHAVSLPFKGYVFAERGLSSDMYAAAEAHVTALRREPEWSEVALEARVPKRKSSGDGRYRYSGARILLVVVMSRDIDKGRTVSGNLAKELELSGAVTPAGRYRHAELAPLVAGVQTFDPGKISLARAEKATLGKPHRERNKGTVVDLKCALDGSAVLALASRDDPRRTTRLPGSVAPSAHIALEPGAPSGVVSALQVRGREARTRVSCLNLPAGDTEISFRLDGALTHDASSREGWWWDWTADNTYEQPERVYRLGDLAESILATTTREPALNDRLVVRIHRAAVQ